MKRILFAVWLGSMAVGLAAERPLGQLPDGQWYIKDEVEFCYKADAARVLSPAGVARKKVETARLRVLHPAITRVSGNHLSAERWLNGLALPAKLQRAGDEVPAIARSLTATLTADADAATVVEELRKNPDVEWASLNLLHPVTHVPNDTHWTNQWGPARINATNAWDVPQSSTTLRIAIIDTGVDLTHPDLASRIAYNKGFGGNDNGDAMRDSRGGSSIDHGTHVAGIAAAIRDNNLGIAGVAHASIMAMGCAVWNTAANRYFVGSSAAALNDAVANGADVVNCSFGMAAPLNAAMRNALNNAQNAGVIVVCAAGNDTNNILNSPSAGWAQHAWPIIVSNVQPGDTLNPSSNFGNRIDLAAPGTTIFSTVTTNYALPSPGGGTYTNMGGTSMASPHVAGAAAMVRSMNPENILAVGTRDLLYRMAQDLGAPGVDISFGHGMVQLSGTFLSILRSATTFAGTNGGSWTPNGSYDRPYGTLSTALAATPSGGTIVLNGGLLPPPNYAAQTISTPVTLRAFPDRPVTIGQ